MRKRSRLTLIALAIVMAMVLSSCWQIRGIKSNLWELTPSDTANISLDLYPVAEWTGDAYPIVVVAFSSYLKNNGRAFDTLGNYDGKENGVKDAGVKQYLLANPDECILAGTSLDQLASSLSNVVVFRTSSPIAFADASYTDALRFKWRASLTPSAVDATPASFAFMTGMWLDDGDLSAESGEFLCSGSYGGSLQVNKP